MATIAEIEQRDREIRAAEATALHNLAAHLREAVIDLPVDSRLARAFVLNAEAFEAAAHYRDARLGSLRLYLLARDLEDDDEEGGE